MAFIANPDLHPGASINRWILAILTFHFELIPVPGTNHGPDGLSWRVPQPGDEPNPPDDINDWVNEMYGFMHMINAAVDAVILVTTIQQLATRCSALNPAIAANVVLLQPASAGAWYYYVLQLLHGCTTFLCKLLWVAPVLAARRVGAGVGARAGAPLGQIRPVRGSNLIKW